MGNSPSISISEEEIEAFCAKCRPLDLLVFKGSNVISKLINVLEKDKLGYGDANHVEVVMTPFWCPKIQLLKKEFKAFPDYEGFKPHPNYLLSWGSELSGDLNDGVLDEETGGVKFGIQFRDLKDLVRSYGINPNGNIGICRLKNNPIENITPEDAAKLKELLCRAHDKYRDKIYDFNILDLLATLYPFLREARDQLQKIIRSEFKGSHFIFCSEFAASLYRDIGVLPSGLDPENVAPEDFMGHDTDIEGVKKDFCEEVVWLK